MSRKPMPSDIAVRRRSDGRFLYTRRGVMCDGDSPKFTDTMDRAVMSVRIDMGLPLSDVEFVTRQALSGSKE